ncbi:Golgi membrane protein 1 isoform 1-T1 [Mantella aurantiaca]
MGLGTGRRGMKSPPLLIAVLLACVFVLGINYWITSSRCVELQNRVLELEGRVRRAAAERGAVEMKKNEYEDMLAKQKKQIDTIQSLHSSQMQTVHLQCNNEKESLLNNVTNKDYLIQNLQVQISNYYKRLEECKLEFKDLQESQTKKLSYELAQCSSKIAEVKEQFEERLRKAGVKVENTVIKDVVKTVTEAEKPKPTTKQEINQHQEYEKEKPRISLRPKLTPPSKDDKEAVPSPVYKEDGNNLKRHVEEKKPSTPTQKSKQEDENRGDAQDSDNQINPENINAAEEDDEPKVEDAEDTETNKENEEVEREHLINIDGLQEDDKGIKQNEQEEDAGNLHDYNGDEANVAESEAEKQAQLIDNKLNLKDNIQKGLKGQAADKEAENGDNPT